MRARSDHTDWGSIGSEAGDIAAFVRGPHGNDSAQRARIVPLGGAVVSARSDDGDVLAQRVADDVLVWQTATGVANAEAHVDDVGTIVDGPLDAAIDVVDDAGSDELVAVLHG